MTSHLRYSQLGLGEVGFGSRDPGLLGSHNKVGFGAHKAKLPSLTLGAYDRPTLPPTAASFSFTVMAAQPSQLLFLADPEKARSCSANSVVSDTPIRLLSPDFSKSLDLFKSYGDVMW